MGSNTNSPITELPLVRDFFHTTPDAVIVFDEKHHILDVNGNACRLYGYTREEFLNLALKDIKPDEFSNHQSEVMKYELAQYSNVRFETVDVKKDGTRFPVEITNISIPEQGTTLIFSIIRNLSSRKDVVSELLKRSKLVSSIVESPSNISIWAIDSDFRYIFFNKTHQQEMVKTWNAHIELGEKVIDYLLDPEYKEAVNSYYTSLFAGNSFNEIEDFTRSNGESIYLRTFGTPITDSSGNINSATIYSWDITEQVILENELRDSLKEKDILLREVHHRVKNNMQIIMSMLNMQFGMHEREEVKKVLKESQSRVKAMALVHEKLYQSDNLSRVDFADYIRSLVRYVLDTHRRNGVYIDLQFDLCDARLHVNSVIPVGLIINELVTNTMKFAFSGREAGKLAVKTRQTEGGVFTLVVEDDGVGLDEGWNDASSPGLGLQMVRALVTQVNGEFSLDSQKGLTAVLTFQSE